MSQKKKYAELDSLVIGNEKKLQKDLTKNYEQVYKEIKAKLKFWTDKGEGNLSVSELFKYNRYQNLIDSILKDLENIDQLKGGNLNKFVMDQYETSYMYSGYILETEYQQKLGYQVLNRNRLIKSIENPLAKVSLKNHSNAVKEQLRQAITASIQQGEGINAAAGRVKRALGKNANNAFRIYQTETTRTNNAANMDSMNKASDAGLQLEKEWVATLDDRTRNSHQKLDGETRPLDQPFSNGLMHPGDPSGTAAEVINCRCTMITKVKGYDNTYDYRRARGLSGKNEIISYANYKDWQRNRVTK
jgi:SPP1 gp7 family putative phage head morphogenesis protein